MASASPSLLPEQALAALEAAPVALVSLARGGVTWGNAAAAQLLGVAAETLPGRPATSFLDARALAQLPGGGQGVRPTQLVATLRRADGREQPVELEPRELGGGQVLLSMRELSLGRREPGLLPALTEVAAQLHRARSVDAVLSTTARELHRLGLQVVLLQLREPGLLSVARLEGTAAFQAAWSERWDASAARGELPLDRLPELLKASPLFGGVVSPLFVRDVPWGVLAMQAEGLSDRPADASALTLFCGQVGSSLETAQAIERLRRTNHQLEAAHAVSFAGSATELQQLVPELLEVALQSTQSDGGALYGLDASGQKLLQLGQVGLPLGAAPTRLADLEDTPVVQLGQDGFAAQLNVPLNANGRPRGLLRLGRKEGPGYGHETVEAAVFLGGPIALQLENTRLHEERRRQVEQLSSLNEVVARISEHLELSEVIRSAEQTLCQMLNVESVSFFLCEPEERVLRLIASCHPRAQGLLQQTVALERPCTPAAAVLEGRAVVRSELQAAAASEPLFSSLKHHAELAVPLMLRGSAVGAVLVGQLKPDRSFTQAEVETAVAVTHHVALAFANARLYEAERRRAEELRLFLDVSRVVTSSVDLEAILETSCRSLARVVNATDAFIWLLEEREPLLKGVACAAPDRREAFLQARVPLGQGVFAARVMEAAEPRVAYAAGALLVDEPTLEGMRSVLGVPLVVRDTPFGAVVLGNRDRTRAWTDADISHASALAGQLAVAVTNFRLYEHLKESFEDLARAQSENVKQERLAALGEVAAVMAHEVRNPLGVIFNALGGLQRILKPSGDAALLFQMLREEAERLNRMVGDLLDFARPAKPDLRPAVVGDILGGAVEAARRILSPELVGMVRVEVQTEPRLPELQLDAEMMRQALLNLVLNGMQAMAKRGGVLTLRAAHEPGPDGGRVRLEVEDTGPGIEPQTRERLFQPFFTTKATGTGLGLSVVKRIVEGHAGEVAVAPGRAGGSRFVIWLPLNPGALTAEGV